MILYSSLTADTEPLDTVVASAKSNGIKLIVPLVNNWADYGGMDVYVKQVNEFPSHGMGSDLILVSDSWIKQP